MQSKPAEAALDDTRLAELAGRQHGVVERKQLLRLGYSRHAIQTRLDRGRLHRIHRGVYAVGHRGLSLRGRWLAAVLACGERAVLSHRAAAALHDLQRTPSGLIDVTSPGRRTIPGIRHHTAAPIHPDEVTELDRIPVTALARTLLDQAPILPARRLLAMLEQAQRAGTLNPPALKATIDRHKSARGVAGLRAALAQIEPDAPWTQSANEARLRELVRDVGLPEPQFNVFVAGELVDCWWPEHGLVVEVDSYAFHGSKRGFASDRTKDAKLLRAGVRVLRIADTRIHGQPATVQEDLAALITRRRDAA
jgi:very-short-patch-repair endonuclease